MTVYKRELAILSNLSVKLLVMATVFIFRLNLRFQTDIERLLREYNSFSVLDKSLTTMMIST